MYQIYHRHTNTERLLTVELHVHTSLLFFFFLVAKGKSVCVLGAQALGALGGGYLALALALAALLL